ncbi:hypothetical protein K373_06329 [Streptomyces sp. DvalAA-21]|nr:hypothetical protein K373_06329 [Streptomyces sp. DvalAA-21]RAJ26862.1 hypothetical protein K351_06274 [Streptomyces sp. DpondAA-E10]RAJ40327.1 hypothetical protein K352_06267 [Streptomyces sp. DpondAA-A50]SCE33879.1 hypothetical protein GA0115235_11732 [Streptomyces sp. DpondAA-F4a]SCM13019.1 hypothetical protein SAMN04883147_109120 [Streptomyces sp. DpondAA-F4]
MWEQCDQFAARPPSRSAGRPCRAAGRFGGSDAADAGADLARRLAQPEEQKRACLALRAAAAAEALALRQPPLTDGAHTVRPAAPGRVRDHFVPAQCCDPLARHPQGPQRCVGVFPRRRCGTHRRPRPTRQRASAEAAPAAPPRVSPLLPAAPRGRPRTGRDIGDRVRPGAGDPRSPCGRQPHDTRLPPGLRAARTAPPDPPPGGPARRRDAGPVRAAGGPRRRTGPVGSRRATGRAGPAAPPAGAAPRRAGRAR